MEATAQTSPLFKLSAEMRNEIYHLVLLEKPSVIVSNAGIPEPGVLSSCKSIREEAIQIYYSQNVFHVRVEDWQSDTLVGWSLKLFGLDAAYGLKPEWDWSVKEDDVNKANLRVWLQRCHENPDFVTPAPKLVPPSTPRLTYKDTLVRTMFHHARLGTGIMTWTEVDKSMAMCWHRLALVHAGWRN
jgi:hypothetical protein